MQLLSQGAEAKIYKKNNLIIKERISKTFRHKLLDEKLRKQRTKREAKILKKLEDIGFHSPKLHSVSDKEMMIHMEYLAGSQLKDVIDKNPSAYGEEIGMKIALLHNQDIIHADLTTSNMILHSDKIHFIDFGLSFFSKKIEDKAVDLHVLERALESKHHEHYHVVFEAVLKGYKQG